MGQSTDLKNDKNRARDPPPTPGNSTMAPGLFQYLNPSLSWLGAPPRSMTRPTIMRLSHNEFLFLIRLEKTHPIKVTTLRLDVKTSASP